MYHLLHTVGTKCNTEVLPLPPVPFPSVCGPQSWKRRAEGHFPNWASPFTNSPCSMHHCAVFAVEFDRATESVGPTLQRRRTNARTGLVTDSKSSRIDACRVRLDEMSTLMEPLPAFDRPQQNSRQLGAKLICRVRCFRGPGSLRGMAR